MMAPLRVNSPCAWPQPSWSHHQDGLECLIRMSWEFLTTFTKGALTCRLRGAAWPRDSVILMVTVMTPGMDVLQRQLSCLWLLLDSRLRESLAICTQSTLASGSPPWFSHSKPTGKMQETRIQAHSLGWWLAF